MSVREVWQLGMYWKRIMLGYTPGPTQEDIQKQQDSLQRQIARRARSMPKAGGWSKG